jgi:valyl-tRNA synthetase
MSKSLGTGIDPVDVISEHGADATRYGLLKMTSSQDVRFNIGAVEEGRWLANKLWNAARLLIEACGDARPEIRPQALEERWILARLDTTRAEVEEALSEFRFFAAADALYHLTRDDFCDWYLEAIKARLYEGDDGARATALAALDRLLRLLHPAMPHVTEEIWSSLPDRETRLIVAAWPEPDDRFAADADALERVQIAAPIFRRSQVTVPMGRDERRIFEAVVKPDRVKGNGNAAVEIDRLKKEVERAEKVLANERFVANAPADVVEAERAKLARYQRELDALAG